MPFASCTFPDTSTTSLYWQWPSWQAAWKAPAAPVLRGVKLARVHLAALRPTAALEPEAAVARPVACDIVSRPAVLRSREHRLRPGTRRLARA